MAAHPEGVVPSMTSVGLEAVDGRQFGVIVAYNTGLLTSRTFIMNRKLHNTASALMVTSVLFALAVMASDPAGLPAPVTTPLAGATAPDAALAELADVTTAAAAHAGPSTQATARRIRQSMALPFFSFVTRG
jgi:hypothetical protein